MNYDELAVVSEQLAGMLRAGMTLPDALRQTASALPAHDMQRRLQVVADRLASGQSLPAALEQTMLPRLFVQMLVIGAASDDLPGALDAAAGHYRQANELRRRMVSMMVYPAAMLVMALLLSVGMSVMTKKLVGDFQEVIVAMLDGGLQPVLTQLAFACAPLNIWITSGLALAIAGIVFTVMMVPPLRQLVRWNMPGLRDACLSQLASGMAMLLSRGISVPDALRLMGETETGRVRQELDAWLERMGAGSAGFKDWTAGSRLLPPMFVRLVNGYGDDLAGGFRAAADVYHDIACLRAGMFVQAGMPMLTVGVMGVALFHVALFALGVMLPLIELMNKLGG